MDSGLYMAWKGKDDDQRIFSSYFGTNHVWTPQRQQDGGTSVGPSLCVVPTEGILMLWKGKYDDDRIFREWFPAGREWESQHDQFQMQGEAGMKTGYGATACIQTLPPGFESDTKMVIWRGSDERMFYCTDIDVREPQVYVVNGTGTSTLPALAFYNGLLYMAWKGGTGDESIYWATYTPWKWTGGGRIADVGTSVGPSLAVYKGILYMAWKGTGDDQGIYWTTFNGSNSWQPQQGVPRVGTSTGPALATFDGFLYMVWKGKYDDPRIFWSYSDGIGWAEQQGNDAVGTSGRPALV